MNGWNFLQSFDEIRKNLPKKVIIYVVSSSVDESDIHRSKNFESVTDYIIKPINREKYRQLLSILPQV